MADAHSAGPLAGTTIIENASFIAGPSACLGLAKLGAQVIRIDPLGGGPDSDRWPVDPCGTSIYWHTLNRGKRSVALDLRSDTGRRLAMDLITAPGTGGGILVENGAARRHLDDALLRERRADLIHVGVTGRADGAPAVDYTVNAATGVPGLTGPADSERPVNHVLPAWDLLCGQAVVSAVLLGLLRRATTGRGSFETIALEDVALSAVADLGWYTEALAADRPRHGNHLFGTFGTDFATADGRHIMVTAITVRQWRGLVEATGRGDVVTALAQALEADFEAEDQRYAHRAVLEAVFAPWFAQRTCAQACAALGETGALFAPYATAAEAAAAWPSTPVLDRVEHSAAGPLITGASPIRVDGAYLRADAPVRLGADTRSVLAERLGLTAAELDDLAAQGVIA
ncbi:2-methylfumaryl-CoA isomerase [Brevibacterium sp. 5221]|uniref:2-methylfumaryl-CoA isomerase n=1 Tax=Brevibacterium rongguiense TaxID=2695267 RepID=A0A6N9H3Q2_9MICO|nr:MULTISPECIES: CoA transferase [Brevibacterium]MYM18575.1 2-methylfumaryl-CoA isomerase [Brevibacterium rongguiense]WAL39649.1 CoA transferase [Brevibacterium sp. BRM-1]